MYGPAFRRDQLCDTHSNSMKDYVAALPPRQVDGPVGSSFDKLMGTLEALRGNLVSINLMDPLARPTETTSMAASDKSINTDNDVWLRIGPVEFYDDTHRNDGVRVTVDINGNTFVYPNIGGADWLKVSPNMAPGVNKVPPSDRYIISASMKTLSKDGTFNFISQNRLIIDKNKIPYSAEYYVFLLGTEGMRGGAVGPQYRYS